MKIPIWIANTLLVFILTGGASWAAWTTDKLITIEKDIAGIKSQIGKPLAAAHDRP